MFFLLSVPICRWAPPYSKIVPATMNVSRTLEYKSWIKHRKTKFSIFIFRLFYLLWLWKIFFHATMNTKWCTFPSETLLNGHSISEYICISSGFRNSFFSSLCRNAIGKKMLLSHGEMLTTYRYGKKTSRYTFKYILTALNNIKKK